MKVLVVGTGGALAGSGITTAADQMVRTLERMGHEPERLVAGSRLRRRPNRLSMENVRAVLSEAAALGRAARASDSEIVWLHTFGVPTLPAIRTLVQVIASRFVRRPIIVHFHAFGLEDLVARAGIVQRCTLRLVGRLSARLVAVHADAAAALEPYAPDRVVVLHNWVDVPADPAPLPPAPPFTAVFVGALTERKGVPQLIEAMRLLDDVPISLRLVGGVGDEGPAVAAAIQQAAADLVASGKVTFAGQLDAGGVRAELAGSHVFVLPSRAEGTPLAMVEALGEGRPVVVTNIGNMAAIVRDAGAGFVLPSRDPPDIADTLRAVIAEADGLASAGERAHRAATDRFSDRASRACIAEVLSQVPTPSRHRRRRSTRAPARRA